MNLAIGMVGALACLAAAPAVRVPAAERLVEQMAPTEVRSDNDGTLKLAGGLGYATGEATPEMAARRFLLEHGAAFGVHHSLRVDHSQKAGRFTAVRLRTELDGIAVRGADVSVLVADPGTVELVVRGARVRGVTPPFRLSAGDAAKVAWQVRPALVPASLTADQLAARARRAYLAAGGADVAAVYVLNIAGAPATDSVEVVVDARSGRVLSRRGLAVFAPPTQASVYDPSPGADGTRAPVTVQLSELSDPPPDPAYLKGNFFETFNCCKRVECVGTGGSCDVQRCLESTSTAGQEARTLVNLRTSELPLPSQITQFCTLPDPLYIDTVWCAEIPRATSAAGDWVFTPVDKTSPVGEALASEEEPFAEVMAYYHLQTFFSHIRNVSGDANFCLHNQDCTGGAPSVAFHVAVNQLAPAFDQNTMQDILCQVCPIPTGGCGGRGTQQNPATLNRYMRVDNAAFVPALDPGSSPIPIHGEAIERDYDSIMMFQGTQRDFAYDGDVLYHEFTHAIIHTVVRNAGMPAGLNGFVRDAWGVYNAAGGLNEGYADYFSESLTGDAVTGEYAASGLQVGETGIRNAGEMHTCPLSITGEVHDDSRAWSSALWAVRTALGGADAATARRIDTAVFAAMAILDADATFADATAATKTTLKSELGGMEAQIDAAFDERGVTDCQRARPVLRDVAGVTELNPDALQPIQFVGKGEVGLTNYAPGHMQLRLDLPRRTRSFTLTFNARGGGLVGSFFGGNPEDASLTLAIKKDSPLATTFNADTAVPDPASIDLTVTPDGQGNISQLVDVPTDIYNNGGTYYVGWKISADNGVTISNMGVTLVVDPEPDAGVPPDAGSSSGSGGDGGGSPPAQRCACATTTDNAPLAALLFLGLAWLLRRRVR